jgi:hypothetical protein
MKKFFILLSLLLVFPFAFAGNDSPGEKDGVISIDMTLSGLVRPVDNFGHSFFDVEGKGTPGKATGRGAGVSGPPLPYLALGDALPEGHTCPDLGEFVPTGMQLMEAQMVMTFNDGSMIWGNSPPDGYVCFTTGYGYAPYDINGGSGRFEGATGWIVIELQTYDYGPDIFPPFLVNPETGTATGEIFLP